MRDLEYAGVYRIKSKRVSAMQWKGMNIGSIRAWGAPVSEDQETGALSLYEHDSESWVRLSLRDYIVKTARGFVKVNWVTFEDTYEELTDADFDTAEHR